MSISQIQQSLRELGSFLTQDQYVQLKPQILNVKNIVEFDEYLNLVDNVLKYINFLNLVYINLYFHSGDIQSYKSLIDTLNVDLNLEYEIINNGKQTINKLYSLKDIGVFDPVLSTFRVVSQANFNAVNNTIYFLPNVTGDINAIAQNITTAYVTTVLQEWPRIQQLFRNIITLADNLEPEEITNSITPPLVTNTSLKTLNDLLEEYRDSWHLFYQTSIDKNNNDIKTLDLFVHKNPIAHPERMRHVNIDSLSNLNDLVHIREEQLKLYLNNTVSKENTPISSTAFDTSKIQLQRNINVLNQIIALFKAQANDIKTNDLNNPTGLNKENEDNSNQNNKESISPSEPEYIEHVEGIQQWGIRFVKKEMDNPLVGPVLEGAFTSEYYYMSLLPARQSTIAMQGGRDTPNAMPGLNFKPIPLVGKQTIPGFQPIFQNLGIKGMQVTIVGCFTGADGKNNITNQLHDVWNNKRTAQQQFALKGGDTVWDDPQGRPFALNSSGYNVNKLNAYNSYIEFQRFVNGGQQVEVEINLNNVYQKSTSNMYNEASPYAEETRLQNKVTANPRFTGVIRSIDLYHATKDRTWYTLIMEVSDFGLASLTPINLNNRLQEAIDTAKAELAALNEKQKQEEALSVPGQDDELNSSLKNLLDRILAIKDPVQREKQLAIMGHLAENLSVIKSKNNYAYRQYNGADQLSFTEWLGTIGNYSDITYMPVKHKGIDSIFLRARVDCGKVLTVNLPCNSELFWLIDGDENSQKPLTRYTGAGFAQNPKRFSNPIDIGFDPIGPYPEENGSASEKSNLLGQSQRLTPAEIAAVVLRGVSCVAAPAIVAGGVTAIGAGVTIVSGGTAAPVSIPATASTAAAAAAVASAKFCAVTTAGNIQTSYGEFNKNDREWDNAVWGDIVADLIWELVTFGVARGIKFGSSKIRGAVSNLPAQGVPVPGGLGDIDINLPNGPLFGGGVTPPVSNPILALPSAGQTGGGILQRLLSLPNPQVLVGRTITVNGIDLPVIEVIADAASNSFNIKVVDNGLVKTIPINQVTGLPADLLAIPVNPVRNTDIPVTPSVPVNTANLEIDKFALPDSVKNQIKSLNNVQKEKVIKLFNVKNTLQDADTGRLILADGTILQFTNRTNVTFDGTKIFFDNTEIPYSNILDTRINSPTTTNITNTPTSNNTPPPALPSAGQTGVTNSPSPVTQTPSSDNLIDKVYPPNLDAPTNVFSAQANANYATLRNYFDVQLDPSKHITIEVTRNGVIQKLTNIDYVTVTPNNQLSIYANNSQVIDFNEITSIIIPR